MSFLKTLIPVLFILRLLPRISDSVLYDRIRLAYGNHGVTSLNRLLNSSKKVQKLHLDIGFLQHCKTYNVVPKFLRFKLYSKSLMSGSFYKSWQDKLLTRELLSKQRDLKKFEVEKLSYERTAAELFGWIRNAQVTRLVNRKVSSLRAATIRTHRKKLASLGVYNSLEPCNPDKVVFNYSSVRITHQLRTLLAFGLDFALPPCKINFFRYYYSFERLAKHMKDKPCRDFHSFIDELRYVSSKIFHKFDSRKFFSVIFRMILILGLNGRRCILFL